MRPKKPEQAEPQGQLFKTRLATFLDGRHPLMQLAERIDWAWFEREFSVGFGDTGRGALPVRLVVGLTILKHTENVSDEVLVERWVENPYWQYFCGCEYFQHTFPCDSTTLVKWRKRLGQDGANKILSETLRLASTLGLVSPKQLCEVVVDTTVQEKNVAFPTDAKLVHVAREKLVVQAKKDGIVLRQSYRRVSKHALFKYARYSHAKQFRRAQRTLKHLRTRLGRVMRDIRRKHEEAKQPMSEAMKHLLSLAMRVFEQARDRTSKSKVYSLHEPEVACIAKGKTHTPYEFGSKVSVVTTAERAWVLGMKSFSGNPYDGSTLKEAIADAQRVTGAPIHTSFVDKGYRGTVHWPEGVNVIVSGRKRLSRRHARLLKRRQAIEPVIGHLKSEHRLDRNFLKGQLGDALNAILAGAAFNFRKLLRWFRFLLSVLLNAIFGAKPPRLQHASS